jgi:metal transporter CNNM
LFRVPESAPLYDILNEFQKGHSHMAVVVKYNKEKSESLQQGRSRQQKSLRSLSVDAAPARRKHFLMQ